MRQNDGRAPAKSPIAPRRGMPYRPRRCASEYLQTDRGMSVLIVGSTALDSIKTPRAEHPRLLGGSASYAAIAASFFAPVRMIGVVGEDFPKKYLQLTANTESTSTACKSSRGNVSLVGRIRGQHEPASHAQDGAGCVRDVCARAAGGVIAPRRLCCSPISRPRCNTTCSTRPAGPSSWPRTRWTSG